MLYFFAPLFYRQTVELHELRREVVGLIEQFGYDKYIDERRGLRGAVSRLFKEMKVECERIKFKEPLDRLGHFRVQVLFVPSAPSLMKLGELQHELNELHDAIDAGLFHRRFYVLEPGEEKFFYDESLRPLPELFGPKVKKSFKSTHNDVIEAGNCYAVGRYTACVFHCMRILEKGLHAFVRHLNTKHNAAINFGKKVEEEQWGRIIDEIQLAVENPKRLKRLNPLPTKDQMRFYSAAAKEFEYFKDAWRNDVSHSRSFYDRPSAQSVMDHVRAFMQQLANNKVKE